MALIRLRCRRRSDPATGGTGLGAANVGTVGTITIDDNTTLDGSFTITATDGVTSSTPAASVTFDNNTTNTLTLSAAVSGDSIIVNAQTNGATLNGGPNNDYIIGNTGVDNITGGAGNDVLVGGAGNDPVNGGAGNDTIRYTFGDGTDTVDGGANTDTLAIIGTSGNDSINVTAAGSVITQLTSGNVTNVENFTLDLLGGTGDTLTYAGTLAAQSIVVNLSTGAATGFTTPIAGVENVVGGAGNDTLTGSSVANTLQGGTGADTLTGGAGIDTFAFAQGVLPELLEGPTIAAQLPAMTLSTILLRAWAATFWICPTLTSDPMRPPAAVLTPP